MEWLLAATNLLVHSLQICACLLLAYGAYVVIVQPREEDRAAPPAETGVVWVPLRSF